METKTTWKKYIFIKENYCKNNIFILPLYANYSIIWALIKWLYSLIGTRFDF